MEKLKQRVHDVVAYKKNARMLQTKIRILENKLPLISEENDGRKEIQRWLADADEILKMASNNSGEKCLFNACKGPNSLWETRNTITNINKTLRKGLDLSFSYWGLSYCKKLQSRENMIEEIFEGLRYTDTNMVGIYGMVGVGKSILVEELARRAETNNMLFEAVVMVQVTDSGNVKLVQTEIANEIGLQLSDSDDEETRAQVLLTKLEEKNLNERKVLVILDGLQDKIDLEKVGVPYLQIGQSSCKVVLVSRNGDVCKEMGCWKNFLVECLNLVEAKILFRQRLRDKLRSMDIMVESERYQYIENAMLAKCEGLPLMINSMSWALRSKSSADWEAIARKVEARTLLGVEELKEVSRPILELVNNLIRKGEKHAYFLLCCLVQQGGDICLRKLMRYVIGFGLFQVDSPDVDSFAYLQSLVHELKSQSILMESKKAWHVEMHDFIRGVVNSALSQGDYVLPVLLDVATCGNKSYERCVAICMRPNSNYKCLSGLELYKLQALSVKGVKDWKWELRNFFQGMQNLRILEISEMEISGYLSSIGDLKNLVTLLLEYCHINRGLNSMISNLASTLEVFSLRGSVVGALPEEIGKLSKLRVLDLTDCHCELETFPIDAIVKQDQLRELYLYGNIWSWSTDDIEKLTCLPLEVLEISISSTLRVSSNAFKFPNLLRRSFIVQHNDAYCLPPSESSDEAYSSFSHVLKIYGLNNRRIEESGFGNLLPNTEFLQIKNCNVLKNNVGDKMKCIIDESRSGHTSFSKLRELRVKDCQHPYVLPIQLALKLKTLEVRNCENLAYIFPRTEINETDGGDSIVKLPCLERLVLQGLKSLLALQDVLSSTRHILFNGKINLPSLKEMHLKGLDEIVNLWDAQLLDLQNGMYNTTPCFGNLKDMSIAWCTKLESLFPSSTIISLLHLEKLQVFACHNMEEVITNTHDEDGTNPTNVLIFPKLQTLELKSLPKLQCFCQGRLQLKFPMLRELVLQNLRQMEAFRLSNAQSLQPECATILFDGEIEFPSLEQLSVEGMEIELIQRRDETTIFPNLLSLKLNSLGNLKALPPACMSQELEELCLLDLNLVEDLLGDENSVDVNICYSLRKLELDYSEVTSIPWKRLTNLRSLTICSRLGHRTNMISSSLLVGGGVLPLLESLKVEDCYSLKSIISQEVAEDTDVVKYGITLFPSLRRICLRDLPKLKRFSMGSYEAHFPSLETLEIDDCNSLKSFSLGPIRTPRLNYVEVNEKNLMEDNTFDDLNAMLAGVISKDEEVEDGKKKVNNEEKDEEDDDDDEDEEEDLIRTPWATAKDDDDEDDDKEDEEDLIRTPWTTAKEEKEARKAVENKFSLDYKQVEASKTISKSQGMVASKAKGSRRFRSERVRN